MKIIFLILTTGMIFFNYTLGIGSETDRLTRALQQIMMNKK